MELFETLNEIMIIRNFLLWITQNIKLLLY